MQPSVAWTAPRGSSSLPDLDELFRLLCGYSAESTGFVSAWRMVGRFWLTFRSGILHSSVGARRSTRFAQAITLKSIAQCLSLRSYCNSKLSLRIVSVGSNLGSHFKNPNPPNKISNFGYLIKTIMFFL